jgi:hypothetical protein
MNVRIKQLRDLVVALDRADRKLDTVDPGVYQGAARAALALTKQEMGLLPIGDFAGPVNALQNFAENLYFATNGCFADVDGSGRAPTAQLQASALVARLRATSAAAGQEVADGLFARLSAPPSRRPPRRAGRSSRSRA